MAGKLPVLVHNDDDPAPITGQQRPNNSTTSGHFEQTTKVANYKAGLSTTKAVGVNVGISKFLRENGFPNSHLLSTKIPDIITLNKDGTVDLTEVPSETDTVPKLQSRMDEAMKTLPPENRGTTEISNIGDPCGGE